MKKKILFISPSLCQGGLEHFQISLLKLLDKEKFDMTLFLYLEDLTLLPLVPKHVKVIIDSNKNHYFRRPKAVVLNVIKIISSLFGFSKLSEKYSEKLKTYIHVERMKHPAKDVFKGQQFDVVVANAIGKATEMAVFVRAQKRYVFFHSSKDMHHDLLDRLFEKYNGVIAVSAGVQDMLCSAYPRHKDKIVLVENYLDANDILEKSRQNLEDFNLDDGDEVKIASCGRLSIEKGFDIAIKAAKILKSRGYNFTWYFIGDGIERQTLEAMVEAADLSKNIVITGYTDNPFNLMKACDIYVQPSYEESYGRTIKEAMILGCPVVSTNTIGAESLIKNYETGVLTDIDDASLADGIETLLKDEVLCEKLKKGYSIEENFLEKQIFIETLENLF